MRQRRKRGWYKKRDRESWDRETKRCMEEKEREEMKGER